MLAVLWFPHAHGMYSTFVPYPPMPLLPHGVFLGRTFVGKTERRYTKQNSSYSWQEWNLPDSDSTQSFTLQTCVLVNNFPFKEMTFAFMLLSIKQSELHFITVNIMWIISSWTAQTATIYFTIHSLMMRTLNIIIPNHTTDLEYNTYYMTFSSLCK